MQGIIGWPDHVWSQVSQLLWQGRTADNHHNPQLSDNMMMPLTVTRPLENGWIVSTEQRRGL